MYESDPGFYDLRRDLQDAGYRAPWMLPDPRDPSLEERTRPEPIVRGLPPAERRLVRALEEGDREPYAC